ncbi:MAG: aminotransferase class V-fold PLP-dependent enzyme [Burkholderiales bacterium]
MSAPRLTEDWLREHVWPRFSRVMRRDGIYLANHSLGRPPDRMAEDVGQALDAWYRDLGDAWQHWLEARERWRALTARLVGAPRADCIVPKTSAGQGLRAVLNALEGRPCVLASDGEFDSLEFILRVYRDKGRIALKIVPWRELDPTGCDLVVVSSVMFRSGEIVAEPAALVRRAHTAGAKVLLDVYHGAGVVPTDLATLEVDFAVGGSYKYLRGGPGTCWLYVRPDHLESLRTLDTGWFAKRDAFAYLRPDPPQFGAGGDAWLESTPAVLAPFQALAGLELMLELGVERLRAYSLEQKHRFAALLRQEALRIEGEGESHGAFLTLPYPRAGELATELEARGVSADARGGQLRLCPDFLNSAAELERAAALLGDLARERSSPRV